MRLILLMLTLITVNRPALAAMAPPATMPELLSYEELMLMSGDERAEYMHQFGELLVMLEDANVRFESAQYNIKDIKEQVALLMRDFAFMPKADAAPDTLEQSLQQGISPKAPPNPQATPPAPEAAPAARPVPVAAPASAPVPAAAPSGPLPTLANPNIPAPADLPAATPQSPEPIAAPASAQTPKKPAVKGGACPVLDDKSADYKKLVDAYKKDMSLHGECIRGGFFSSYDGGKYRFKGCKAQNFTFSEATKSKTKHTGITCSNGQQLCNPAPFCFGAPYKSKDKSEKFAVGKICAPVDQHFTRHCHDILEEKLGKPFNFGSDKPKLKKIEAKYKDENARTCKPEDVFPSPGFSSVYNDLRKHTQDKLDSLCGKNQNFHALFCEECSSMGGFIVAMNKPFEEKHARAKPEGEPGKPGKPGKDGHHKGGRRPPGADHVDKDPDAAQ